MKTFNRALAALVCILMGCIMALPSFAFVENDSGEDVRNLQTVLYVLGYLETEPDGIYGQQTRKAAARLQSYVSSAGLDLTEEQLYDEWRKGRISPVSGDLSRGDKSEAVMLLQRRLRVLGYLADKADGRFGDHTVRAVQVFQHDNGLGVTGIADETTRKTLFAAETGNAAYRVLSKGMRGDDVLRLQQALWLLGFFTGDLDGQYGSETVTGVKALETYIRIGQFFGDWDQALRDTLPEGIADPLLLSAVYDDFPAPPAMDGTDTGQEVYRLQRRLSALGYLNEEADGGYGENTKAAVGAFQKRAGLKATGKADEKTIEKLFSPDAPEAVRPYKLVIDLGDQAIYVYQIKDGEYKKLAYTMACSAGSNAAVGNYELLTRPDREWIEMQNFGWAAYVYQIEPGLFIHSVPFDEKGGNADTAYLSALGRPSAYSGIMVSTENARLIWQKCIARTPIEIRE